jgi:hypothetical protein
VCNEDKTPEELAEEEEWLYEEALPKRMATPCAFPLQPIEWDGHGVIRFRENRIVRKLLDEGPFDMNDIARFEGITDDERSQFAQLIGYSVSGYGDLSYALGVNEADAIAEKLSLKRSK